MGLISKLLTISSLSGISVIFVVVSVTPCPLNMNQITLLHCQPVWYEIVFCSGECLDYVPSFSPDIQIVDGLTGHVSGSWKNLKWDGGGVVCIIHMCI